MGYMTNTNKGTKMTKFALYQVPFENDLIRDIRFMNPLEVEAVSDQFELVGTVEAKDLNDVFHIGNMERQKFTVVGDMVSVSVGDIIHNLTTDETHVVDRFGFVKINMKEVA
jgi:hypothetical protein